MAVTGNPTFAWKLHSTDSGARQNAYQISVSIRGKELWNTGRIRSDQSQMVLYAGDPLESSKRYDVELIVWDQSGQKARSSIWFETAPDELRASWIGALRSQDANLPQGRHWHAPSLKKNKGMYDSIPELAKRSIMLRKEWTAKKDIAQAKVHVSGLGHYELSINGSRVGKSQFAPLWTDYDKTVFYNTLDVTGQLSRDKNAFGVLLGNGMYNVIGDRYRKFWVSFGPPTLFFQLEIEYSDGTRETVISDESWKYSVSPITFNCIFGGEDYDARLEQQGWNTVAFDDTDWQPVVLQDAPGGRLTPQTAPDVAIHEVFDFKTHKQVDSATHVFDMGQNLAGFPSIKVSGEAGQTVRLVVGERTDDSGRVTQKNTGSPHIYEYTLDGNGIESWQPAFSYYGYQFIQIEGVNFGGLTRDLPQLHSIKSNFVYNNAEQVGSFECSNDLFNKTHELIVNAVKSNMQAVLTDCPHREKLGWLEQVHLVGPGLIYNYDLKTLLPKVMRDMADAQRDNGLVPNIAPEYTDFSHFSWGKDFTDSPEWGMAVIILPWLYYEYYGDSSLFSTYFDTLQRYVEYLESRATGHILSHGLGDWYDYGEHRAGYSKNSPIALSATAHYYWCTWKLSEAAGMVNKPLVQRQWSEQAAIIKSAFNQEFYNDELKEYGSGSQYCQSVALYMGLVESTEREPVLNKLVDNIRENNNRLTTGDIGNRYLFQVLADHDLNELMYKMHNHEEAPGYGYQVKYGVTTLTEQWDPEKGNSWNHFMMGQIDEWFYRSLAGIKSDEMQPGFKHFFVAPEVVGDLKYVKASTESPYGTIAVSWTRTDSSFEIDITVPVNSTATFLPPTVVGGSEVILGAGSHHLSYKLKAES